MQETMAKTKTYDEKLSPIILKDLSEYSGINIPNKMQPSSLTMYENKIYVGTKNSRIFIYTLDGQNFKNQEKVVANYKIVSSITINHMYFILTPETLQASSLSVWDKKTKNFQIALRGHQSQISSVIFLDKKGHIATSSWDATIKIWYLEETFSYEDPVLELKNQDYPIITMKAYSKSVLIFGDDECFIKFWNWEENQIIDKILGHGGSVTYLHPSEYFLLTGGGDHVFKVIEAKRIQNDQQDLKQMNSQLKIAENNSFKEVSKKSSFQGKKNEKQNHEDEIMEKMSDNDQGQEKKENQKQKFQEKLSEVIHKSQQMSIDLEKTYKFETIKEIKQFNYDSRLFDVQLKDKTLIFDHQGRMYLFDRANPNAQNPITLAGNPFLYNQNIAGVAVQNDLIIVATTKSTVKLFSYKLKRF